jgi:hypothetical protein
MEIAANPGMINSSVTNSITSVDSQQDITAVNITYSILLAISLISLIAAAITEPGIIPRN